MDDGNRKTKRLVEMEPDWILQNGSIIGIVFSCPVDPFCYISAVWGMKLRSKWLKEGIGFKDICLNPSTDWEPSEDCNFRGFIKRGVVHWE